MSPSCLFSDSSHAEYTKNYPVWLFSPDICFQWERLVDRFLSNIKQKMLNNSSLMTRNSHGLRFSYCFFLQVQETKTSVHGIPALLIGEINAVFSLLAVVGNALILAASQRKSSLRTPFYIFLVRTSGYRPCYRFYHQTNVCDLHYSEI